MAALVVSIISLVVASSGIADAAREAIVSAVGGGNGHHAAAQIYAVQAAGKHSGKGSAGKGAGHGKGGSGSAKVGGYRVSSKPLPHSLLLLNAKGKLPASVIPTVKDASAIGGMSLEKLVEKLKPGCPPDTVNLGTWCLEDSPYPLTNQDQGLNDYKWAAQKCVEEGGFLPSAAQLIGAANRVKIEGKVEENRDSATVAEDPTVGLKDQREMSSTLATTAAGSEAAGSEGVSEKDTGDPRTGEPDPVPLPPNPEPATLQYVTVYSNGTKGGFAGSQPVSEPENFRCAYDEMPGANSAEEG
jgi:hypothetical protein